MNGFPFGALNRLRDSFVANPAVWVLLGLLALAECGNYQTGHDLRTVCELTEPHDVSVPDRYALTKQQKIDNICLSHEPDD